MLGSNDLIDRLAVVPSALDAAGLAPPRGEAIVLQQSDRADDRWVGLATANDPVFLAYL